MFFMFTFNYIIFFRSLRQRKLEFFLSVSHSIIFVLFFSSLENPLLIAGFQLISANYCTVVPFSMANALIIYDSEGVCWEEEDGDAGGGEDEGGGGGVLLCAHQGPGPRLR